MKFNRTLLGLSLSLALFACHDNQVKNIETKALLDNLKNPNYVQTMSLLTLVKTVITTDSKIKMQHVVDIFLAQFNFLVLG